MDVELFPLAIARAFGGMRLAGILTSAWLNFLGDEVVLSKEFKDAVASTSNTPFYLNHIEYTMIISNASSLSTSFFCFGLVLVSAAAADLVVDDCFGVDSEDSISALVLVTAARFPFLPREKSR